MSAGQEIGSPIRENRTLLPAPLPPDEPRGTLAAAAGVSTVGLRPPFDTPAAAFSSRLSRRSHLDCRAAHRAITGSQGFSTDLEPPIKTVRSSKSANRIVRISGFEIFEPGRNLECDVVGVDFLHPSPTHDFAEWRSKIIEHTLVDVINIALWPRPPHQRRNRLDQEVWLLLAVRQGLVSAVAPL